MSGDSMCASVSNEEIFLKKSDHRQSQPETAWVETLPQCTDVPGNQACSKRRAGQYLLLKNNRLISLCQTSNICKTWTWRRKKSKNYFKWIYILGIALVKETFKDYSKGLVWFSVCFLRAVGRGYFVFVLDSWMPLGSFRNLKTVRMSPLWDTIRDWQNQC